MFSLPLLHQPPGAVCRLNSTAVIPLKQRSMRRLLYMSAQTKTKRRNDNVCAFPQHLLQKTLQTVIAAKWFAIRGIRLISQTKGAAFVSPSYSCWVIWLQKETFHSVGFHFLVTDFPVNAWRTLRNLFNLGKFRFIFIPQIYVPPPPAQTTILSWAAYTGVGFLHLLWSPPTVQKRWALAWLESLNCPQVWACQRRSCTRYSCLSPGDCWDRLQHALWRWRQISGG